jgi:GTP-binding protein
MSSMPRILIMGRPNVGKSTLFNRLLGRKRALVHDLPGVTRDRLEEKTEWPWKGSMIPVRLIDTGGLGAGHFSREIEEQVESGLADADIVLVVFDGQTGMTMEDRDVIRKMRTSGLTQQKPVIGVVNKVDAEIHEEFQNDFFQAGFDRLMTVSAEHNRGIDDLKNEIFSICHEHEHPALLELSDEDAEDEFEEEAVDEELSEEEASSEPTLPRIAIVGRPNVGKSTLVNALLGQKRMITSPMAGTTVDAVDSLAEIDGRPCVLIDTAGIRRKSRTDEGVEVLSVIQAKKALERADIALLVLDGETGLTEQDEKIGGLIEEMGCSVVLIVNKWDTQASNPDFSKDDAAERVRKKMAFLKYAPVMFTSGLKRQGLRGMGDLIEEILSQRAVKVATHEFTEWVRKEANVHNPMNAKFYLSHQVSRHPPTFVCHVSDPEKVHFSLKRHLINALRERWGFMGTPVRILFVAGKSKRKAKTTQQLQKKAAESRDKKARWKKKVGEKASAARKSARSPAKPGSRR